MMVTIKVIKIRMMMLAVVTMVIIVMSVVEDLKEELTESHLLASEERSARCSDRGSVALSEEDNDYHDDQIFQPAREENLESHSTVGLL